MNTALRVLCVLAAGVPAALADAQPLGSPVPPTIANPNRFAVTGVDAAARFVRLATTRRVDIAIIGDSNTRLSASTGHEDAMGRAFAARFGMYASRVDPFSGQGVWTPEVLSSATFQFGPFLQAGAPAAAEQYFFTSLSFPTGYAFLPGGVETGFTYNAGLVLRPTHPIGIESHLRYHLSDYSLPGGSYAISIRSPFPNNPYVNFFGYQAAPAATPGMRDLEFDIPAGTRSPDGIFIVPGDAQNQRSSVGPLLPVYHRVERVDRATGVAYSPMWAAGSQSARGVLQTFYESDRNVTAMHEWMRQATRLQDAEAVLLVHVMHGGNDAADSRPSLGPISGLPSSSSAGQEDNTRGIISWLRARWVESGRDPANLFFLLGPYHPRADTGLPQLGYEQGWRAIAGSDPQVFTVAGNMLSTPQEFAVRGFLLNGDPYHLSPLGFQTWADATIRAIDLALCPGDYDGNHELGVADIFGFLNAWLAGSIDADFDYSGTLGVQDIFDFLNAWFAGCS
ncbi:MAG TPA: GC-type dockerin domain-anchored protein [Phycisphaerales bacterium]|nr:GC-type dockerin domain-anchored protein [Phycisphaerales bacterium]